MNVIPDDDAETLARIEEERREHIRVARIETHNAELQEELDEAMSMRLLCEDVGVQLRRQCHELEDDLREAQRRQMIRSQVCNAIREYHLARKLERQERRFNRMLENRRITYDSLLSTHVDLVYDFQMEESLGTDRMERIKDLEEQVERLDPPQGWLATAQRDAMAKGLFKTLFSWIIVSNVTTILYPLHARAWSALARALDADRSRGWNKS